MRITMMTLGTRGDVQPFMTLAQGLNRTGHDVTVSSSASFGWLAEESGVRFEPLELDFTELQSSDTGAAVMRGELSAVLKALRQVKPMFRRSLMDQKRVIEVTDPEVLLTHPKTLGGPHLAEWRGIPYAGALVVPGFTTTGAFPPIPLTWTGTPHWLNRLTYQMIPLGMRSFEGIVTDWRRSELGLDHAKSLWDGGKRMMYGYSPTVVPNPDDWPPTARAVGYWLADPVPDWGDPALSAFIDGGKPPVYVGFGSNVDDDPVALGRLIADAVHEAGVRAVVQTGQGLIESEASHRIYVTGPLPHSWLFPKMACVVHHGGSGTTGEAIRARRPQVIVPFTTDQPFWATRMRHLGVSPEPLSRKRLTVASLAGSIVQATTDQSITRAATELGDRVLAEDGIAGAAEYLSALTTIAKG